MLFLDFPFYLSTFNAIYSNQNTNLKSKHDKHDEDFIVHPSLGSNNFTGIDLCFSKILLTLKFLAFIKSFAFQGKEKVTRIEKQKVSKSVRCEMCIELPEFLSRFVFIFYFTQNIFHKTTKYNFDFYFADSCNIKPFFKWHLFRRVFLTDSLPVDCQTNFILLRKLFKVSSITRIFTILTLFENSSLASPFSGVQMR